MKKAHIMIFVGILILSLTSCGKDAGKSAASTSAPAQNAETSAGQKKQISAGYADIMKSGKFLIRYKTTVTDEGKKAEAEITNAIDGKNAATIMKTKEMSTHTIIKDNVLYMLDDAGKTYYKMSMGQNNQSSKNGSLTDTDGMKYVSSGTGTVNGKTLPYDEYSADDTAMRFYMDGKNLYAITTKTSVLPESSSLPLTQCR